MMDKETRNAWSDCEPLVAPAHDPDIELVEYFCIQCDQRFDGTRHRIGEPQCDCSKFHNGIKQMGFQSDAGLDEKPSKTPVEPKAFSIPPIEKAYKISTGHTYDTLGMAAIEQITMAFFAWYESDNHNKLYMGGL